MTGLDWAMIVALLLFSLAVGLLVKDKASEGGMEGFFVAGRKMRWWFLGTSIVATTFASDTPLAITGWIAQYGIAGNWFWWSEVIAAVAMTVFFARKWRNSGVVTDVEIAELRYGGAQATVLRTVKASVFSTFVNCIILGWVFAGMAKISEPFMHWEALLGPGIYSFIEAWYPESLMFQTLDNSITIVLLLMVTLFYSTLGGLRAVMITDLVQFILAMSMSILVAYLAVQHVGGLESMWGQLDTLYPADADSEFLSAERVASFAPAFGEGVTGSLGIPFTAFVLTLGVMWWTSGKVDGSGYIAQRLYSAEDGGQAEKGALWYAFANFMMRSWPWAIAGVAALVIYPRAEVTQVAQDFTNCLQDASYCTAQIATCMDNRYACEISEYALLYKDVDASGNTVFLEDRERGYPAMIRDVMPVGLLGLALASLMAAFMSTVSTHINWGASYIANDFYKRFFDPNASDRRMTWVGRLSTLGIALVSAWVATFIDNIGSMWELYGGMMAGLGLPHLMRWFWWRANAWTEISGMVIGLSLATINFAVGQTSGYGEGQMSIFPAFMASHAVHVIAWISLAAGIGSLITTFLTRPVDESILEEFARRVRPMGFWNGHNHGYSSERGLLASVVYWCTGTVSIYAGMFGIGYLLKLNYALGFGLLALSIVALVITVHGINAVDRGAGDQA
ncbi:sodium:solute symporter family protein [Halioglobus sp. HI00S01]|uniref:sodium:solute symporter family protein n=2 Tax=Halioglobus sp. HI00S01 TaxID=1822214 RepID=UPI0012E88A05|nr:sodium:solute symporter family protein [Halioglobus sp. HI00S01]